MKRAFREAVGYKDCEVPLMLGREHSMPMGHPHFVRVLSAGSLWPAVKAAVSLGARAVRVEAAGDHETSDGNLVFGGGSDPLVHSWGREWAWAFAVFDGKKTKIRPYLRDHDDRGYFVVYWDY